MALIEVRGLTKLYRMGSAIVRALDGVDMRIEQGEFVAITGASGSGKSTMMHVLGCLDRPTGGHYLLNGRDVSRLSDRELAAVRNKYIGFVFQTFNLINRTNALENVAVPLFYARQAHTLPPARRALERVGLTARAHHNPNELSGGERQRVAIARAIVNDPPLLFADEPTGNLDSRTGEQIMEIFHGLNRQGVTIVMVTHEPDIARQAQRIVMMRDGKILSDRPTAEVVAEQGPLPLPVHLLTPDADAGGSGAAPEAQPVARGVGPAATAGRPVMGAVAPATAPIATPAPMEPAAFSAQKMRGATPSLVCGILALVALLGLFVGGSILSANFKPPPPGAAPAMPPTWVMVVGLALLGDLLLGFGLGALAIAFGIGALRRIRTEPGLWTGRWHARLGIIFGVVAAGLPIVLAIVNLVMRAR